jgi:hypothetical protein
METFSNGIVIMLVGMGGTLVSLLGLTFLIDLLKRLLPYREETGKKGKEVA